MERTYGALGSDSVGEVHDIEERVHVGSLGYATSAPFVSPAVDAFDEAFDGDHDVDYWFWNGTRLIPASPDEAGHFRQQEAQERAERFLASARRRSTSRASQISRGSPWRPLLSPLFACRDALLRVFGTRSSSDAQKMGGRG